MDQEHTAPYIDHFDSVPQQHSSLNDIQNAFRGKWLLVLGGGLLLMVLFVVLFSQGRSRQLPIPEQAPVEIVPITGIPTPTMTVEYKQAISEAQQSATTFQSGRDEVRAEFPWIRKFPISGEGKYFVYFDKDKKIFIGKLYPKPGDSIEQLKQKAKEYMQQREIPTDAYPFEWRVTTP